MGIVYLLIALVILTLGLMLLNRILSKLLPELGLDADWIFIVKGIIGLVILCLLLGYYGYGYGWLPFR